MRVGISGAGGFIGKHLVATLKHHGHQPIALTREPAGTLRPPDTELDALVHLAFPTNPELRTARPLQALRDALATTASALLLAEELGAGQLILASSGKVYGHPLALPITEDHALVPTTFLGQLKLLCEGAAATASGPASFGISVLRIFNVYGPGQAESFVVPKLLAGLRRGGSLTLGQLDHARDWVHVEDVCRALLCLLDKPGPRPSLRTFNVGSGRSASVRQLLEIAERASGKKLAIVQDLSALRADEPAQERADTQALAELGWRARVDLNAGIGALWRAFAAS
jgi:nucleoside-diphosphate-sugar epimerase